ncbi:MAG: YHS domain-containing protein, partial [Rhodocyclaceae bacterium]|nr:YHS domain-containing protein [Rhodocyclaceae bacterium]
MHSHQPEGEPPAAPARHPGHHHKAGAGHGHAAHPHAGAGAKDPVCGMEVPVDAGKPSAVHEGQRYHFCSQKCHDAFVADPARYLAGKAPAHAAPRGGKWTCPMHPEIVRDAPGACPKCGMA